MGKKRQKRLTERQSLKKRVARKEFKPNLFGAFLMSFLGFKHEDLVKLAEVEGVLIGEKKSEPESSGPDSLGTRG